MNTVILSRLAETILYHPDYGFTWNDTPISWKDCSVEQVGDFSQPFGDQNDPRSRIDNKPDSWHIGRIQYLAKNPPNDPISLDNSCSGMYIEPRCIITDGNHRVLAAILRGDKTIQANYCGRMDLFDYITGKSDTLPTE